MYYTYMLRCADNSIYTGITTDIERRFSEHSGDIPGKAAKYTKSHKAVRLEAAWESQNRETASRLEYYIKKLPKRKKEHLITNSENLKNFLSDKVDCSAYKPFNFK
ncbi:MAG: GIY-YIG nuclease family protein [Anaerovoracaceae bacterium]